ncbi:MAG: hypothetical protein AAB965_00435 [Patescibacteria group bacterium]
MTGINQKIKGPGRIALRGGQVMITVVTLFLFLSLSFIVGVSDPILRQASITKSFLDSRKSYLLAESGVEDASYRVIAGKQVFASEVISLDGGSATTLVTSTSGTKTITSDAIKNNLVRKVETTLQMGIGTSFHFGIQTGAGGLTLNNNAMIYGNVYSNGPIHGDHNTSVTGSVVSASSSPSGSLIDELNIGVDGVGDGNAYTIADSNVQGGLYCISGSGNNKSCDSSKPIPTPVELPISEESIATWQTDATAGGIINGNYTLPSSGSLGPKKIIGNLTIVNNKILTLTGTIWVTGNIVVENNAGIKLSSSYGANSGVVVAGGKMNISNNATLEGSGQTGSYLLFLTTSDCPINPSCDGDYAIDISNNVSAIMFNAQRGTIHMSNNASIKEATAYKIVLESNATVNYESGLANINFVSGPSGGWNIGSWKEVE